MNILVSNLASTASGLQVKTLFSEFGLVQSATIIRHDVSQKLNNYCWVVMQNSNDAEQAIKELDDTSFCTKILMWNKPYLPCTVSEGNSNSGSILFL